MNKDLFGKDIGPTIDPAIEELKQYDINSFTERVRRLKYVNKVFPFGRREYGSDESFRIFSEAIHCYIFGQFVATIILSQSFIERRFQEYFNIRMDEERAKYTLDKLLKYFKENKFLDEHIITKIDKIRLKRNPFVHHRKPLSEHTMMARAIQSNIGPDQLIEDDAKDALEVMLAISRMRII